MKIYKNDDEIKGKIWKTIEKILLNLKKLIIFKYSLKFWKKIKPFLITFYVNLRNLQDS